MANTIKIKRSAISGKVPTTAQLELGELAVNTHDGKLYTKKDDGTAAVVEIGGTASTADALTTARSIALSGDVSGSTSFDGSANVTITATVADDSHNHVISNVDGLQTALDAKAPLASPTFTGTPAAPTAAAGTNTTQVATTAFVSTAVANVVDAAPGALDTLNELAAALGDDANFSTTVTNSIATKLPLAGGQMTGNITFSGTQTVDGRDLSVDGAKLDGIASGAQVNVATNLAQGTRTTTTVPVTSSTGTNATLTAATTSLAGVMTSADKSKLDGIASGATNVTNNNQLTNGAGYITSSGSISGNAATATTLQTARTIGLGGDVSGSASFNGSANITITATVADDSHNHVISNVDGLQTALDGKVTTTYNSTLNSDSRNSYGVTRLYRRDSNSDYSVQTSWTGSRWLLYGYVGDTGHAGCEVAYSTSAGSVSNTLTRGSYLTGSNFNGSSATTWAVDATSSNTAGKVVVRDGNGDFSGRYLNASYFNHSHGVSTRNSDTQFYSSTDNYIRKNTASGMRASLSVPHLAGNNTFTLAQRGQVDALSSSSSITPNFANSNNFSLTLATNTTINNPSNLVAGQSGAITIYYSGNRTVAFGSYWKFPGGTAPTMTSTSGKYDVIVYYVESSTRISAQVLLNTGG